jgi:hypothetical protein
MLFKFATCAESSFRRVKGFDWLAQGSAKLESTVGCLGIEVDDALEISEQTEI